MEANFQQKEGRLYLNVIARSNLERTMLEEFMQKQISGYKHSFHYDYDKSTDSLQIHFRPIISKVNLLKEGFKSGKIEYLYDKGDTYIKRFNCLIIMINTFGSVFWFKPTKDGSELIHKRVSDIQELRIYIKENEKIWLSY